MSFKIIVFASAIFACQVSAHMGGIVRPFVAGFSSGLNEMAKPFVQFGQNAMAPAREYMTGSRRPQVSQWMNYPSQMIPQTGGYEGFEAAPSRLPGGNYFQMGRPFQPQMQYYPMGNRPGMMGPPRPFPPGPAPGPFPGPAPGPAPGPFPGPAPGPAPGPFPGPAPGPAPESEPEQASSSSEESEEVYTPSDLLIQPDVEAEVETPEELTVEGEVDIPTLQRPLPVAEDQE